MERRDRQNTMKISRLSLSWDAIQKQHWLFLIYLFMFKSETSENEAICEWRL